MLGFVVRFSRGIGSPLALKSLYCSLVRQGLEYASVVWSPYTATDRQRLDNIQDRFLRLVCVRNGYQYRDAPIADCAQVLGLHPLGLRRDAADLGILHKLLNGSLNCPELLYEVDIRVPGRTRSRALFGRRHRSTSYDANSPLARLLCLGNMLSNDVDFFFDNYDQARTKFLAVLAARP